MRLTGTGVVVVSTAVGLFALGWWTTDNLLVLVGLVLGTPVVADLFLGRRSLREVTVGRRLPAEVFADVPARGSFVVGGVVGSLCVVDTLGGAQAELSSSGTVAATWRLPRRGRWVLSQIALSSRWPLGLIEHRRVVGRPVQVWVAPRPIAGPNTVCPAVADVDVAQSRARVGDFAQLRAYRESDPARAIHWRTSARRGELVVVERAGQGGQAVIIEVPDLVGEAWERALERATGAFIDALRSSPVTLSIDGRQYGPAHDGRFRATVLRALAEARVR